MNYTQRKARKYVAKILSLPYLSKKTVFIADLISIAIAFTIASFVCYSLAVKPVHPIPFIIKLALCVIINGLFFILFTTYRGVLRYSSFRDSLRVFLSLLLANIVLWIALLTIYNEPFLSSILIFINFVLGFSAIVFGRMMVRLFFDYVKTIYTNKKHLPLLIFGTSATHISLAKMIRDNEYLPYSIAGFISSNSRKMNQKIMNYPVYSKSDFISDASNFQHINSLLIVSEELEPAEKKLLVEKCMQYKIELLSAPLLDSDWKTEEKKIRKINKIRIEDLLGRVPIQTDVKLIENDLTGKTILITGAAGSIGSEIVRQLCCFDVKMLLLCDIAESPLHQLNLELNNSFPSVKKQLLIADVRNYERMKFIFEQYQPQYIYHAAAYKHVPLMEEHPSEAVLTNVMGTKNVADLAVNYGAECFVMISTDKAVNPSSVMGASKRIAEIYIQYLTHHQTERPGKTSVRFITTRFGNVLGSNGSVIPLFAKQIETGGPITVTHPEIIRYFMTITEACNLVLEAGCLGLGGEVFVFDMGESVKIKDMAESMIRLSGLEPYKDIDIIYTGLRPGEKLYEELLYDHKEKILPTRHEKIMISEVTECNYEEVFPLLCRLIKITGNDDPMEIVKLMKKIVPEFISLNSIYCALDKENYTQKCTFA
ncbi:MAG: polysaccharide biosynthesis protein [Candidatus Azobacteroides sp.]|nr:polysaccharide biosynthesis protein [Candidatus Azobacteroides sp.]